MNAAPLPGCTVLTPCQVVTVSDLCYGLAMATPAVEYEFTVVIERDEDDRFVAICPGLQGCYTEGETETEARDAIKDAIRLHVEDRLAAGEPILREVGTEKVRIAV